VKFVVDKLALGQVFILVLLFSPVSIIPPMLLTHLHLHVALTRRTIGRGLRTLISNALSEFGEHWTEKYLQLFRLQAVKQSAGSKQGGRNALYSSTRPV
jgi:hypothetical protein